MEKNPNKNNKTKGKNVKRKGNYFKRGKRRRNNQVFGGQKPYPCTRVF